MSCWLFVSESGDAMDHMAADQAAAVSRTLALASETPLAEQDRAELSRIGANLLKTPGVVALAFLGPSGKPLSVSARDGCLAPAWFSGLGRYRSSKANGADASDAAPFQPHRHTLDGLGPFLELTTPVTRQASSAAANAPLGAGRLVGFVTLCLAQRENEYRVRNIALSVVLIGAGAILVSLPVTYGLVHRIFAPIRELVAAADRIARGDFSARVAFDRPDVIGTLARSFNEMAVCVRQQRHELAEANQQLSAANVQLGEANSRLAEANRDLEEKVSQRTAQVESTAAALTAANRRLSGEIAEKESFLRTVSHDLAAPLRNIEGIASMLLMKHREQFDPDVIHRLERIQKNVQAESNLIAELLELSRIKTRRQRMEPVDLNELIREVAEMFTQDLENRRISLVLEGAFPALTCERARMRQVFQNLIDNAIKYMGTGGDQPGAESTNEIRVGGRATTGSLSSSCVTTASGSSRKKWRRSSTSSAAARMRRREASKGGASGWRPSRASLRRTAARSGWKAVQAREAPSDSP